MTEIKLSARRAPTVWALAITGFMAVAVVLPAVAADLQWKRGKIQYIAERKELKLFLREFAAAQGIGISIDPDVQGVLNGRYDLTPDSMLELIGATFGVSWYFDGRVLYVFPSTNLMTKVIRLKYMSGPELERTLQRLGIADSRFPLTYEDDQASVRISGPKQFVELVEQTVASADRSRPDDQVTETRVFPLRYAFAADYAFQQGGKEYKVAGVATLLRQLYAGPSTAAPANNARRLSALLPAPGERVSNNARVRGTDLTVGVPPMIPKLRDEEEGSRDGSSSVQPSFVADPRTNAVLIKDSPQRLSTYSTLIATLDVRPKIVELEASIVEISSDDFNSLGVDWRFLNNRIDLQNGAGARVNPIVSPANAGVFPNPGILGPTLGSALNVQGAVLSAVLGDRNKLIARISALEERGKAQTRAQPKVMTLNNVEAILESLSTFYVQVQGFQDSQLFPISVGISIRITPSVVSTVDQKDSLRLLIKIEDGSVTDRLVQQLPVVQTTSISTQTLVPEGTTLLLAGYSQDKETESRTGVPGLSSLPLFGGLFRSTDKTRQRVERLFMITPRVVDLEPVLNN
jgi:type III secretion protein C